MAFRGVWQLKKLVVNFCDYSGSSRGTRGFIDTILPSFISENPQLEVTTQLLRGRHPYFKGFFANKNERVVDLRNLSNKEVLVQATRLRNSSGRKVLTNMELKISVASWMNPHSWVFDADDLSP